METRIEKIVVQGADEPHILRVRETRHGPLISDIEPWSALNGFSITFDESDPENIELTVLSLKWTALEPGKTLQSIFMYNQADNFEEFSEACSYFQAPAQNMVYADLDGNIGYSIAGVIPERKKGHGIAPVPGWNDEYEWLGMISHDEFPSSYKRSVKLMGSNMQNWKWGDIHQAEFRNAALGESGIGIIEHIFNRGPVPVDGGNEPVLAARWRVSNPFDVRIVPAMRQIIDLSNLESGLMVHAPGQSGHPANPHYDDLIESWRKVEYHPTLRAKGSTHVRARKKLVLEPK